MKRPLVALAWVVVLLGVGGAVGFYYLKGEESKGADKYRTEGAERGDVTMNVTATGTISAVTTVLVGSQVSGIISRLYADFNSPVTKGQILAELDPTPFQASVEQNRANLEQAEVQYRNSDIQFKRMERLLKESLVAESDYDSAKADRDGAAAKVQQGKAALEQAETNLRYTKILSPIGGVVVDRQYDVGQTVAAAFQAPTLFTIAQDLTRMQVQADVDQSDIGRVKTGQNARFTVDAYPEEDFHGKITQLRLNATVNQNVVTYPVIIEVPNPDMKLRPKMTADIRIEVAKVTNVLRIPNAALRFRPTEGASASGGRGGGAAAGGGAGGGSGRSWAGRNGGGGSPSGGAPNGGGSVSAGGREGAQGSPSAVASNTPPGAEQGPGAAGPAGRREWRAGGRGAGRPGASEANAGGAPDGAHAGTAGAASGDHQGGGGQPAGGSGPPMWGGTPGLGSAMRQIEGGVGGGAGRGQTIYVLEGKDKLKPVEIRTGISDGRYTEVVAGPLEPGQRVVVGLATARAEQTAGGPPRAPGGRMF